MNISEDPEILNVLGVDDLQINGIDNYDFPEIAVWVLSQALELAYQKGYAQGIKDHIKNGH